MKREYVLTALAALSLLTTGVARADESTRDSLKVIDIEEVVVIAAPKENRKLRDLPGAATLLSQQDMKAAQVRSVKSLTSLVPNLFIPDYGSKLTTSIYIRGIGSRINTPSVGLYVDNIPSIDKSAFDFSYADVERIDVLRGPQGTLYGRNTMAGLVKVHTKSPFTYQGTDLRAEGGAYNDYRASLTHYHRISERFAFSAGGFYEHTGGFFENAARGYERIDRSDAGGGRIRAIVLPNDNLKVDMSVSYEYGDQGGYPYEYMGVTEGEEDRERYIGKIAYNERSGYRRGMLNAGVNVEYQAPRFILSAVTGYQNLTDRMFLDQDFTELDIYTLQQRQRVNTLSEEIILKSKPGSDWQWTTGAFAFYQWLHTNAPVQFRSEGVKSVIEDNVNGVFESLPSQAPSMRMTANNETLTIEGRFDTPTWNGAVFHQSTLNNLAGVRGLSATVGLRLDYERMTMDYRSFSEPLDFDFSVMGITASHLNATTSFVGDESDDYLQLLPKFALQYEWKRGNSVYATAAKGYRSGGYNIQLFSDLAQGALRNSMLDALATHPSFSRMSSYILSLKEADPDVRQATRYKPEYTWSYELGSHLTLWDGKLWADLAAFYMDTRDQQVAQFAASGLGRTTTNAGRSRSYGAELSARANLTDRLHLNVAYGYTRATFTDYVVRQEQADGTLTERENYNGNYVPFVPRHTLNVGGEYVFECRPSFFFRRVILQANYSGAGRIYWTESNDTHQPFYGTLNGQVTFETERVSLSVWGRNLLDKDYSTFYFETMGRSFRQPGKPVQGGVSVRCRL